MTRLYHPNCGYHVPENSGQRDELFKAGWIEITDEMWAEILAKKKEGPEALNAYMAKLMDKGADEDGEEPKRKPGRPKKA